MSEGQIPPIDKALTARSSIWLTCPDCDHTTRMLAVMAGRVLRERRQCPRCLSTRAPHMSQTVSGAHIPGSEAHHATLSEDEEAYLRAWIESDGNKQQPQRWFGVLIHWLAARFSRTRTVRAETQPAPAVDIADLHLKPAEDDLS